MRNDTRTRFDNYTARIAELNHVQPEVVGSGKTFSVDPSVQQTLVTRMQDTTAFLKAINILPVTELRGEKLGVTMNSTVAGRTDTSTAGNYRHGQDPTGLDNFQYELAQTNFDVKLTYAKLDAWAKFPDFEARIRNAVVIRQALDRIMIGWNGASVAATTDRTANPLLEDVNKGWLQLLLEQRPEGLMTEVENGVLAGKVTYGAGGDYKNLDALVWDAKETLLPPWAREDPELVVILGSELLHDKYFAIIDTDENSLNQLARQTLMSQTRNFGGLPAVRVPFFPADALCITRLDNLSLYYQESGVRRLIQDQPWANGITDYQSSNEGYVIEDLQYICAVQNIQGKDS